MMTPEQAALFNDATRNDLMTLLAQRPATNKQLSEALGRPKGTIGHHLKVLEEARSRKDKAADTAGSDD